MSERFRYEKLDIWNGGMAISESIYDLTKGFPNSETFGLASQMRKAAVSIPANIAEGSGRETQGAFAQFVRVSRGSLYELRTLVTIAHRVGYVSEDDAVSLSARLTVLSKQIESFLKTLRGPEVREEVQPYN